MTRNKRAQPANASAVASIDELRSIMAALRTPVTGCPWDLEQTFETIAPYTLEEAYEVVDAIERGDMGDLREELGDLLLQVVYHAQMAAERDAFTFDDVVAGICDKMIRRHPHVFGDAQARQAGAAKGFWEAAKEREKAQAQGERSGAERSRTLDGVPRPLPALVRAIKLQNKAARVGFDWPDAAPVFDKIAEETQELRQAMSAGDGDAVHEEFGDLLFAFANLARHLGIDAEAALRSANTKFSRRFAAMEDGLAQSGRTPQDASLDELEALWGDAKRAERDGISDAG